MNQAETDSAAIEARAAQWLARQDGERWSAADQQALTRWLDEDVRHRVAYLRLYAAWREADEGAAGVVQQPLSAAPAAAPAAGRGGARNAASWRIAAALLLTCALGTWLALPGQEDPQHYATRIGESRAVALADGSRIVLNTATRLRAAPDSGRKVWLDSGEAYFDIAHDPAQPFVVEAGSSRVTVLGTRFTVRREADRLTVLVAQGRVRLSAAAAAVELTRNEMAVARAGSIRRTAHGADKTAHLLAWRDGRLMFERTTLADAVAQFNRYNERQLVVTDAQAGQIEIGGTFAPSNVDGFLRLLEQGFGLQVEQRGKTVAISR